jgi:hypothetical protein
VLLFVAGGYYSISRSHSFVRFLVEALAFWLLQAFFKAFQLYLSIKYTALSLFCFRACPFFSSIYPSTNSSTLLFFSPLSPYPIPSPLTFSLFFFFFRPSPLPFAPPLPRHSLLSMDDTQTAFATQYPPYGFDLDMMKVRIFSLNFFRGISLTPLLVAPHGYRWWSRRQKGPLVAQLVWRTHR